LYNCVTGKKVEVDDKINFETLNQIATIQSSENGFKFKFSDLLKVDTSLKTVKANDNLLNT